MQKSTSHTIPAQFSHKIAPFLDLTAGSINIIAEFGQFC